MPKPPSTAAVAARSASGLKRALLYLRVSTPGQVNNDYNPEGISIPAQREAGTAKARAMDAVVVGEYVEPGRTATEIDKRPEYQKMVGRVRSERDVDYVIVYQFSRIFRNSLEAAIAKNELRRLGVRIVSTNLDLGDTPEAQMVEMIVHAVDEYQAKANAADVRYKMAQKVKNGGTISRAPIGYRNVQIEVEGRKVRTVEIDPVRGPLISNAFAWFATGKFSGEALLARLTDAGLTSRPQKNKPERPLGQSTLYKILRDRYYTGRVCAGGDWIAARHPALTDDATFDRVQRLLDARVGEGTRARRHSHHLKGRLWCHRCHKRLMIHRAKGNGGIYYYFFCRGRQLGECRLPFLMVEDVESSVDKRYGTVRLDAEFIALVRTQFDAALLDELAATQQVKRHLEARLVQLDLEEDRYFGLVGNPAWPQAKLDAKMAAIQQERLEIASKLTKVEADLATGKELFHRALDYLNDPQALYRQLTPVGQGLLTKLIFGELHLDTDDSGAVRVADDVLRPPFDAMVTAYRSRARAPRGYARRSGPILAHNDSWGSQTAAPTWDSFTMADLLTTGLSGAGLSKAAMVEVAGIEPASFGDKPGLLRAQRAVVFSAPPVTHASRCRAQSLFGVPHSPVAGEFGEPPGDASIPAGGTPGLTAT